MERVVCGGLVCGPADSRGLVFPAGIRGLPGGGGDAGIVALYPVSPCGVLLQSVPPRHGFPCGFVPGATGHQQICGVLNAVDGWVLDIINVVRQNICICFLHIKCSYF